MSKNLEDLKKLVISISNIHGYTAEILRTIIPVMKNFDNEIDSIIDDVHEAIDDEDYDDKKIVDITNQIILTISDDASKVRQELDTFCGFILNNQPVDDAKCPFMAEVWNGDSYDKTELEGIKQLESELKTYAKTSIANMVAYRIKPSIKRQ